MPIAYDLMDLTGKVYVVTGANTGLGLSSCVAFVKQGAHVVMACRDQVKGAAALKQLEAAAKEGGKGGAELMVLDLASLESIKAFAAEVAKKHPVVHCLLNNAGVMNCPLMRTQDGFEMQMGTNHFGHFALTLLLLPLLRKADKSRVVNVSSMAAWGNLGIQFEDINCETQGYNGWLRYGASKLANQVFSFELQRKLEAAGVSNIAVVMAHPGVTSTELMRHTWWAPSLITTSLFMDTDRGALSQIIASCGTAVTPLEYYGPSLLAVGDPHLCTACPYAANPTHGERLWKISEELTKVSFPF